MYVRSGQIANPRHSSLIKGLFCTLGYILRQPKIGVGNLQLSSYLVLVDPGIQVGPFSLGSLASESLSLPSFPCY